MAAHGLHAYQGALPAAPPVGAPRRYGFRADAQLPAAQQPSATSARRRMEYESDVATTILTWLRVDFSALVPRHGPAGFSAEAVPSEQFARAAADGSLLADVVSTLCPARLPANAVERSRGRGRDRAAARSAPSPPMPVGRAPGSHAAAYAGYGGGAGRPLESGLMDASPGASSHHHHHHPYRGPADDPDARVMRHQYKQNMKRMRSAFLALLEETVGQRTEAAAPPEPDVNSDTGLANQSAAAAPLAPVNVATRRRAFESIFNEAVEIHPSESITPVLRVAELIMAIALLRPENSTEYVWSMKRIPCESVRISVVHSLKRSCKILHLPIDQYLFSDILAGAVPQSSEEQSGAIAQSVANAARYREQQNRAARDGDGHAAGSGGERVDSSPSWALDSASETMDTSSHASTAPYLGASAASGSPALKAEVPAPGQESPLVGQHVRDASPSGPFRGGSRNEPSRNAFVAGELNPRLSERHASVSPVRESNVAGPASAAARMVAMGRAQVAHTGVPADAAPAPFDRRMPHPHVPPLDERFIGDRKFSYVTNDSAVRSPVTSPFHPRDVAAAGVNSRVADDLMRSTADDIVQSRIATPMEPPGKVFEADYTGGPHAWQHGAPGEGGLPGHGRYAWDDGSGAWPHGGEHSPVALNSPLGRTRSPLPPGHPERAYYEASAQLREVQYHQMLLQDMERHRGRSFAARGYGRAPHGDDPMLARVGGYDHPQYYGQQRPAVFRRRASDPEAVMSRQMDSRAMHSDRRRSWNAASGRQPESPVPTEDFYVRRPPPPSGGFGTSAPLSRGHAGASDTDLGGAGNAFSGGDFNARSADEVVPTPVDNILAEAQIPDTYTSGVRRDTREVGDIPAIPTAAATLAAAGPEAPTTAMSHPTSHVYASAMNENAEGIALVEYETDHPLSTPVDAVIRESMTEGAAPSSAAAALIGDQHPNGVVGITGSGVGAGGAEESDAPHLRVAERESGRYSQLLTPGVHAHGAGNVLADSFASGSNSERDPDIARTWNEPGPQAVGQDVTDDHTDMSGSPALNVKPYDSSHPTYSSAVDPDVMAQNERGRSRTGAGEHFDTEGYAASPSGQEYRLQELSITDTSYQHGTTRDVGIANSGKANVADTDYGAASTVDQAFGSAAPSSYRDSVMSAMDRDLARWEPHDAESEYLSRSVQVLPDGDVVLSSTAVVSDEPFERSGHREISSHQEDAGDDGHQFATEDSPADIPGEHLASRNVRTEHGNAVDAEGTRETFQRLEALHVTNGDESDPRETHGGPAISMHVTQGHKSVDQPAVPGPLPITPQTALSGQDASTELRPERVLSDTVGAARGELARDVGGAQEVYRGIDERGTYHDMARTGSRVHRDHTIADYSDDGAAGLGHTDLRDHPHGIPRTRGTHTDGVPEGTSVTVEDHTRLHGGEREWTPDTPNIGIEQYHIQSGGSDYVTLPQTPGVATSGHDHHAESPQADKHAEPREGLSERHFAERTSDGTTERHVASGSHSDSAEGQGRGASMSVSGAESGDALRARARPGDDAGNIVDTQQDEKYFTSQMDWQPPVAADPGHHRSGTPGSSQPLEYDFVSPPGSESGFDNWRNSIDAGSSGETYPRNLSAGSEDPTGGSKHLSAAGDGSFSGRRRSSARDGNEYDYYSPRAPFDKSPFESPVPATPESPPAAEELLYPYDGSLEADGHVLPRAVSTMAPSGDLFNKLISMCHEAEKDIVVSGRPSSKFTDARADPGNASRSTGTVENILATAGVVDGSLAEHHDSGEASSAAEGLADENEGEATEATRSSLRKRPLAMRISGSTEDVIEWNDEDENIDVPAPEGSEEREEDVTTVQSHEWDAVLEPKNRRSGKSSRARSMRAKKGALGEDIYSSSFNHTTNLVPSEVAGAGDAEVEAQERQDVLASDEHQTREDDELAGTENVPGERIRIDRKNLDWLTLELLAARDAIHQKDIELELRSKAHSEEKEVLLLERKDAESVVNAMTKLLKDRESELLEARERLALTLEASRRQAEREAQAHALAQANAQAQEQHSRERQARMRAEQGELDVAVEKSRGLNAQGVDTEAREKADEHAQMRELWTEVQKHIEDKVLAMIDRRDTELSSLRAELTERQRVIDELHRSKDDLMKRNMAAESEIAQVKMSQRNQFARKDEQLAEMQGQLLCVTRFSKKLEDMYAETEHLRAEVAESQAKMAAIASSTGITTREAKELRDALENAQAEVAKWQQVAETARAEQRDAMHRADETERLLQGAEALRSNPRRRDAEVSDDGSGVYQGDNQGGRQRAHHIADPAQRPVRAAARITGGGPAQQAGPARILDAAKKTFGVFIAPRPPKHDYVRRNGLGTHYAPGRPDAPGAGRSRRAGAAVGDGAGGPFRRLPRHSPERERRRNGDAVAATNAPEDWDNRYPANRYGPEGTYEGDHSVASGDSDGFGNAAAPVGQPQVGYSNEHGYIPAGGNEVRVKDFL